VASDKYRQLDEAAKNAEDALWSTITAWLRHRKSARAVLEVLHGRFSTKALRPVQEFYLDEDPLRYCGA
jgi:hypothetical protein